MLRVFALIGVALFIVQVSATTIYEGILSSMIGNRLELDEEMSQIQSTMDDLSNTSMDFLKDENRLYASFGLSKQDESARALATGGAVNHDSLLLRKSAPVFEKASVLGETAHRISGRLAQNDASFKSLNKYMETKLSMWRYVPSISPTKGRFASSFGPRIHPVTGQVGKMHQGVDISNNTWTPIYASADGVIDVAQHSTSFGNYVAIDHGNGIKTRYGHMQVYTVKPGEFVERYQLIGYMGNTGMSVGPHLHYEVWVNNAPVNPLAYMLPNDHSIE